MMRRSKLCFRREGGGGIPKWGPNILENIFCKLFCSQIVLQFVLQPATEANCKRPFNHILTFTTSRNIIYSLRFKPYSNGRGYVSMIGKLVRKYSIIMSAISRHDIIWSRSPCRVRRPKPAYFVMYLITYANHYFFP